MNLGSRNNREMVFSAHFECFFARFLEARALFVFVAASLSLSSYAYIFSTVHYSGSREKK